MADPVTSVEIEDVLSSIRRLVSAGERADEPEKPEKNQAPATPPKFVLTPALRVTEPSELVESTHASTPDPIIEDDSTLVVFEDEDETEEHQSTGENKQSARDSLEATIAELEAAVLGQPDEWEPDGSEVNSIPTWDTVSYPPLDEVEDAVSVDETSAEEMRGDTTPANKAPASGAEPSVDIHEPWLEVASNKGKPQDADPIFTNGAFIPEDATYSVDDPLPTEEDEDRFADVQNVQTLTFAHSQPIQLPDDPTDEFGDELAPDPEPIGEDEDLGSYMLSNGQSVDEEALRQLVMDVVRDELQGDLGERITRNVRKMVRREINRALDMQDFD